MPIVARARAQVLVVGAGPVGLLAALGLRQQGIDVRIVEQQSEHSVHSFPVVLQPLTLRILSALELTEALFWRGRPINQLGVYTEHERRAVLDLPPVAGISAGALTLPQDVLRQVMTNALSLRGVSVEWDTRLSRLQQDQRSVRGWLVRREPALATPSRGAAEAFDAFETDYVIGADGYDSSVREALGIELAAQGPLQSFAFFDAVTKRAGAEAQLALSDVHADAVYPLQGGMARFSFQITRRLNEEPGLDTLRELIATRLPWYAEVVESCDWSGVAEFRQALAVRFGAGRVWLAGEAAHQTGPLGVQSLNVGLDEASELSRLMGEALRRSHHSTFGEDYAAKRKQQWRELLGLEQRATLSARTPTWARRNLSRLLACLPASGADLDDLFDQLRLEPSCPPGARPS